MNSFEFSAVDDETGTPPVKALSPAPLATLRGSKQLKKKWKEKDKQSIFSKVFQAITCCLPSWARFFIVNVYHASIPETMWFEDVGDLPHFYKNMITLVYNSFYFGIFFYFVKTAYDSNRQTFFVSLDVGAGECEEIGRPTTGEFLISTGINSSDYAYESFPNFMYNNSAYVLELDSYQTTFPEFQVHMRNAAAALQLLDVRGQERDLAWNSIVWNSFEYVSREEGQGVFSLRTLGDPGMLYGNGMLLASITAPIGACELDVDVTFEEDNAKYKLVIENYGLNNSCPNFLNVDKLQKQTLQQEGADDDHVAFAARAGGDGSNAGVFDLRFDLDMNAYTMATAINLGVMTEHEFVQMADSSLPGPSDDDFVSDDDDDDDDDDATSSSTETPTEFPTEAPTVVGGRRLQGTNSPGKSLNARRLDNAARRLGVDVAAPESIESDLDIYTDSSTRMLKDTTGKYPLDISSVYKFRNVVRRLNAKQSVLPQRTRREATLDKRRHAELVAQTRSKVNFDFIRRFNDRHRRAMWDTGRRLDGFNATAGDVMFAYYNQHAVGMNPVYCMRVRDDGGRLCFIEANSQIMYPIFNTLGTLDVEGFIQSYLNFTFVGLGCPTRSAPCRKVDLSPLDPTNMRCTPCGRTMDALDATTCDYPNLLTSTLFFPYDDDHMTQLYTFALKAIDIRGRHGDTHISNLAFLPAVSSVFQTLGLDFTGETLAALGIEATNRFEEMYADLCANCTMITITKLADSGRLMNFYALKPTHRSCSANLIENIDSYNVLIESPPIELTERYFECVMTQYDAIFEALGLSMGNADLFTAAGTMFVLMLVSGWLRGVHNYHDNVFEPPPPDSDSESDDDEEEDGLDGNKNEDDEVQQQVSSVALRKTEDRLKRLSATLLHDCECVHEVDAEAQKGLALAQMKLFGLIEALRAVPPHTDAGKAANAKGYTQAMATKEDVLKLQAQITTQQKIMVDALQLLFVDREREKSLRAKLAANTSQVIAELADMRLAVKIQETDEHHL